ncbi:DUF2147 domain-containing protein [uncultured Phenylobacterium sp.]|uniref:DUF2147 domain-containing protein n=1 Tax=uncultured Phenylobacterium sp. TaxID=349273 RepID=UPI0025FB68EA|nr:DUF2147 domain-containing protein [uncultured Phenylobacterium sp.]
MRRFSSLILAAAIALTAVPTWAAAPLTAVGVWRNPKDSVHIALRPCGEEICGFVVWASDKAKAKARKGGTPNLVGQQLMRGFVVDKHGVGRGKVFVPDLNKVFTGSATMTSERTLLAKGCLFAGVLCKTQVWTRIDTPS